MMLTRIATQGSSQARQAARSTVSRLHLTQQARARMRTLASSRLLVRSTGSSKPIVVALSSSSSHPPMQLRYFSEPAPGTPTPLSTKPTPTYTKITTNDGMGGGASNNNSTYLSAAAAAIVGGGAYYYYQNYYLQDKEPAIISEGIPRATETVDKVVAVVQEQVGPYGVDITQDRLYYDMNAAVKQYTKAAHAKYQADTQEISASHARDKADIEQDYHAAVVQVETDFAKEMTKAAGKGNPELVEIAMETANAKKEANLKYHQTIRNYRLEQAEQVYQARTDAAKKMQAARNATRSNMELALQKFAKAQRDAQKQFDADMADANSLIDQARDDALAMATKHKHKALEKALVAKEQADDAALRAEDDAIAKANKVLESTIAATERSVKKHMQAQEDYLESLLSVYADVAQQKFKLAKANLHGKLDPAYVESIRLVDNTKNAALSTAESARDKALEGVEYAKKELLDKAITNVDDAMSSTLGGIMNSLYAIKDSAVSEVKRDTKAVTSKLSSEKQKIAKWYKDSVDGAIKEYKKDVAAIKETYNKAYKEAAAKKGAARERALKAIREQKEADEARAERMMKEMTGAAERSRQRSDKAIADMEAYFAEVDNP